MTKLRNRVFTSLRAAGYYKSEFRDERYISWRVESRGCSKIGSVHILIVTLY